jgi:uncharacterized protein (TIGR03435 family)
MPRLLLVLVSMVAVSVTLPAQSRLDVVSVRENPARNPPFSVDFVFRPGRFDIINLSLESLVAHGYGITSLRLRDQFIVGWPNSEIRDKRFDIRGTLSTNETLSFEDQRRVVLEVLETRFGLQTHREQRLFDHWVMALVKPGVLGPRLKRVDFNCAEIKQEDAQKDEGGRSLCRRGAEFLPGQSMSYHGSGSMDALAEGLQGQSRNLVVNETGLQGFFVWDFVYRSGEVPGPNVIPTSVHEDLGIKMEPKRLPADIVVIDDIRMPTPN